MAAADEAELVHMVATAVRSTTAPARSAIRAAKASASNAGEGTPLEIGKGRILREGSKIAMLSLRHAACGSLKAAEKLAAYGLSTTVADARFAKPLDKDLIRRLAREHEVLITIEEGAIGGFASQVMPELAEQRRAG